MLYRRADTGKSRLRAGDVKREGTTFLRRAEWHVDEKRTAKFGRNTARMSNG
jgi:hypothetical protein